MQVYCGTDIIEVDRIENAIINTKGFKENVYTKSEIYDIEKIRGKLKYQRYAGRFAAKEEIYKAMSKILIENGISLDFCDVEVVNQPELLKRPKVNFFNEKINEIINRCNVQIDISISHIEKTAVATAIVKID